MRSETLNDIKQRLRSIPMSTASGKLTTINGRDIVHHKDGTYSDGIGVRKYNRMTLEQLAESLYNIQEQAQAAVAVLSSQDHPPKAPGNDDWFWVIQYTDEFKSEADADQALTVLAEQDGFITGRTLPPTGQVGKNTWRVQVFFEDNVKTRDFSGISRSAEWLPEGLRRVIMRPSMIEHFARKG